LGLVSAAKCIVPLRRHGIVLGTDAGRVAQHPQWATTIELAAAMADYIDNFHNVEPRHSYLGNISPTEFETLWTSTYSIPQLA
jgi:transposase InsO family protein